LVLIALCYPALRTTNLFPTTLLLDAAASLDADRAASLKFRFDNEDRLLQRASERFWFGWGRFGRNRVYSETGRDLSITDGEWIIRLGIFGFVGFVAEFGLIAFSVFRVLPAIKFAESKRDSIFISALALIVAINLVDLLPNASISPWTWFLAGALMGQAERLRARRESIH